MPSYQSILMVSAMAALVVARFGPNETSLEQLSRYHPRDVLIKRSRDCGTFTMYCGGLPKAGGGDRSAAAPMACANACAYVNVFATSFTAVYKDNTDNDRNRIQSGCRKKSGSSQGVSVCNIAPFSQQFHDPLEEDSANPSFNCDEFPVAEMSQPDFDPNNVPRNTLRCIDQSQNSAAGGQLSNFVAGTGWYNQDESVNGGRSNECSGQLKDGDTYKVAFNYDGIDEDDKKKIPFCSDGSGNPLMPPEEWDFKNEFYLTQLPTSTGTIDFPYDRSNDNTYANALTKTNVLQCSVVVYRTGDAKFQADITYGDGTEASGSATLSSDGKAFTANPPVGNKYQPLKITRTEALGTGDGTPVGFVYAPGNLIFNFQWASNTVGADNTLNLQRPGDVQDFPNRYCLWTQVDGETNEQTITCYFPCIEPVAGSN